MRRIQSCLCALGVTASMLFVWGCGEPTVNETKETSKGEAPPPASVSGIDTSNQEAYAKSMKTKMGTYGQGSTYPGANRRPQ